ncbi:MAG: ribosome small subunit-dependent GTPase A [Chloroflexota bacterium]
MRSSRKGGPRVGGRERVGTVREGLVTRTESGFHQVLAGDRMIVSRAPKRLLQGDRVATTAVVIGDRVRIREAEDGTGEIDEILPRDNELLRGAAGGRYFVDVIAANLGQLIAVHSLKEPDLNPARLDRFILIAEAAEIPAVVCLNKVDLATPAELSAATSYTHAGYRVLLTSARTGAGIPALGAALSGKVSAMVGPSGVGKSSLLNAVQPGLSLRTGEISTSTGKGRHTTTTAELLALTSGGWVADTPGLRELAIREVEPEDLAWLYPEFRPLMTLCRFTDCSHREELDCAIRAAVDGGTVSPTRYKSYLRVYDDLVRNQPF